MALTSFHGWVEEKRMFQEYADNPLLDMKQQEGDKVYFGIHDLDRYYKTHGSIPSLEFADIMDKAGEISDVDPVDSKVLVLAPKDPYQFGYHNLESKSQRNRRKKRDDGKADVKIPVDCLIDVSHLIDGEHKVWLVVDQKTKYQAGLMKQIRRREMRAYMDADTQSGVYALDDKDNPLDLGVDVGFKMMNREVEPYYSIRGFDPSIQKHESCWKYHVDTKKYSYYPE